MVPRAVTFAALPVVAILALAACAPGSTAPAVQLGDAPPADVVALPDGGVDTALEELPGIVERVREELGIPGLAVAVVHDGETVFAEGYGVRELGTDEPIDVDTVFQIASMSKPMGATVVATQVADGVVDWATPVADALPAFRLADPWVAEHVTVADLYAHRSGLPMAAGDDLEDVGYDRAYILDHLVHQPLDPFRSTYHYANFGITAGAEAVATAAGTDWATLAEQELYEPLGMESTSSRYEDFLERENRATLHTLVDGEFVALYDRDPDEQSPAGGVSSSVTDVARWMALVLGEGTYGGEELIPADALTPALHPHSFTTPEGHEGAPENRAAMYGYGFGVGVDATGRTVISHSGAFVLGAATTVRLVPDLDLGITVLTNGAPIGAPEAIAAEFLDIVAFGESTRDWVTGYGQVIGAYQDPAGDLAGVERPTAPAPAADLATYAGDYANVYFGTASVVADGDRLIVRLGPDGGYELALEHWDGDVFSSVPHGENAPAGSLTSVSFDVDGGAAHSMTIPFFDTNGLGTWTR